jgi:L-fuculose-phosphate aldolase
VSESGVSESGVSEPGVSTTGTGTDPRLELIRVARQMAAEHLVRGTSGNLSVRDGDGYWITPTGLPYELLQPTDVVFMSLAGRVEGCRAPSSEWQVHHDLYVARPQVGAVLHAHPPFAVALACLRREIPAFHYMVARFGGDNVRCAGYATYGTQELSDAVLLALRDRTGCLLANHGILVCGSDLDQALGSGVELEELCGQYWRACQLGEPVLLSAAEMALVLARFAGYGQPAGPARSAG